MIAQCVPDSDRQLAGQDIFNGLANHFAAPAAGKTGRLTVPESIQPKMPGDQIPDVIYRTY
jgi:hypothetical protein